MKGGEDTVTQKRRLQYEEEIEEADGTSNYDTWFNYTRLEEEYYRSLLEEDASGATLESACNKVRNVYERALRLVPPAPEKRLWRRYIYLWLRYALFEELDAQDLDRAKKVYASGLSLVPHQEFTFAKLWLNYAKFEIRRLDLPLARKLLGTAIGVSPKP